MTNIAAIIAKQDLEQLDALIGNVESYIACQGRPLEPIEPSAVWAFSREGRNVVEQARAIDRSDVAAVRKWIHRLSGVILRWNLHLISCEAGRIALARGQA